MGGMIFKNGGLLTTVQDLGRFGYGDSGITPSGAMDEFSLKAANILVGNHRGEGCLEITMFGPHIIFSEPCIIALTGGDLGAHLNGYRIKPNKTLYINRGDELKFTGKVRGMRAYLSVKGGFNVERVLSSKSTHLKGEFGGFSGRKMESGDELEFNGGHGKHNIGVRNLPKDMVEELFSDEPIRVIMGPEENRFSQNGVETFLNKEYEITNQSDRMGFRLKGHKIEHKDGADIISGGITMGAVQVPGHGEPIIMMADRQTTGGYTKIANVISVDLPRLAQVGPGKRISFKKVDVLEAQELLRRRERNLDELERQWEEFGYEEYKERKQFIIGVNGKNFNVGIMSEE